MNQTLPTPSSPPRSAVSWTDPFVITLVILGAYYLLRQTALTNVELIIALVGAVMAYIVPVETMRSPAMRASRPDISFGTTLKRAAIKTLGILAGLDLVLLGWFFITEYARPEYRSLFDAMQLVLPFTPIVVFLWVLWSEWRLGPLEDHSWHFGLMALCRFQDVRWIPLRDGLFSWLVKGFFLPLNVTSAVNLIGRFRGKEVQLLSYDWSHTLNALDSMIFTVLLIAIIPGYLFSARILGTEIKKVDHTWFGWMVTFFCYPPVNRGTGSGWFAYRDKESTITPWIAIFGTQGLTSDLAWGLQGVGSTIIGCILLMTYIVHYWGEAICCLRSSHLTNRGIITNGPFRVCKHPVYVIKLIGWFFTFMPFFYGTTIQSTLTRGFAFLAFCVVYATRAWIEERLLSTDPDYVAYALWMDEHSWFRSIGKRFPIMSFKWRLQRWEKNKANILAT